ncbi:MAG TPA: Rieske 2Fe-2S domain-containing protein [Vicinamibacteria bacterium]|nr:Rieske 2Fe-2S domain-containing protein [Vicinamibacteria bacterium]
MKAVGVSEVSPGSCVEVSVGGTPVAVYNVGGTFYATSNTCIHRGGPLGQGMLEGCTVMCPWHAWTWDVRTGENTANPSLKIGVFEVKVEGPEVFVRLGDGTAPG